MANKMIIDASHPEETRVVVLRGNRVEEFDFESASKKQLRGNIYLAKVTRVEPSLQAAFVEYGGNRHGFLAFSEIHPDYYQIPHADRAALLEEESRAHREEEDEDTSRRRSRRHRRGSERRRPNDDERVTGEILGDDEPGASAQSGESAREDGQAAQDFAPEQGVEIPGGPEAEFVEAAEFEGEAAPDGAVAAQEWSVDADSVQQSVAVELLAVAEQEPVLEVAPSVEASPRAASHELASDPEGFAIVEEAGDEPGETHDDTFVARAPEAAFFEPRESREAVDPDEALGENGEEEGTSARRFAVRDRDQEGDNGVHEDRESGDREGGESGEEEEIVEQLGGDAMDEAPYRMPRLRRQYKIQEVIKRRQVLLIQVVKEERGNKGAALTTYLSLAGRYSVLMPNTARGGGISRKITDAVDRKRLKEIAQELDVPEGMGVILRTAGASRTKPEVKRDFEYLMRMWETVRELTLSSSAPALVYEEGSLIKRAIRDLYNKDIDDVVVAGEAGYREARDFMRLLMPSHVKNVQFYTEPQPIFAKWGAESQLDALFHTQVTLKSGGYLVINQTEALVAIDVNSGRSTREHNIEDTALRTNLEAADEVARQLRLRDLAGLIVVDFIDMEESRNNRAVERRIKEALKDDRARIQVGRISHFGLLEMSRQRIRTGVLEGSSVICPHCAGAGTVRSTASVAVHVMRVLEDALIKSASHNVILRTRTVIALYILNQKRSLLRVIEERFGVSVTVEADDSLTGGAYHALERGEPATGPAPDPLRRFDPRRAIDDIEPIGEAESEADFDEEIEPETEAAEGESSEAGGENGDAENRRRRRRRRGRGRNFERDASVADPNAPQPSDEGLETMAEIGGDLIAPVESGGEEEPSPEAPREEGPDERRRGRGRWRRRGGRGARDGENGEFAGDWRPTGETASNENEAGELSQLTAPAAETDEAVPPTPESRVHPAFAAPEAAHEPASPEAVAEAAPVPVHIEPAPVPVAATPEPRSQPAQKSRSESRPEPLQESQPLPEAAPSPVPRQIELPVITAADPDKPKRSGWWARAKANIAGN
ncbi:Rne/Rng family ribonuclease [uncultured Rhodoblastus sp.]|uniref:Rne/Rng family ribonuclease n=1 Tax=uncultured Rhodoblastus sp. TaxID=543037 RepID=UPI0025FB2F32|nr:Rne/Rng family ribonuclease [uncultured Rhodoblastus sp.]